MYSVIARTQGTAYPYLVGQTRANASSVTDYEFETVEAAKAASARHYRTTCNNSGKPTMEATYTLIDLSKAVAVSTVTPPPDLTWQ